MIASTPRLGIPRLVAVLAVGACSAVGPDYHPPTAAVPDAFRETGAVLVAAEPDLAQWWHRLDDAVLDGLVEQATRQNLDL
ncbi:MAG TPA: RND transporter, partial [Burkholderiaceae bacterium]|nr:RND transporter [Burkholderiaceae bacterium]